MHGMHITYKDDDWSTWTDINEDSNWKHVTMLLWHVQTQGIESNITQVGSICTVVVTKL